MAKQAFGGDDDSSGQQPPQQTKKLVLDKFASKPDMNIRDLFWEIIANYAMKKPLTKEELKALTHERIALIRIALSVLKNPQSAYFGLGRNTTALYSLMLMLDGEWEDAFTEMIVGSYEEEGKPDTTLVAAINKIGENEKYREQIKEILRKMMRNHDKIQAVLAYLSKTSNKDILLALKKEIMIIAKSDIEKNQYYAMLTLAKIMDEESKNVLISLINHWDVETRRTAVDLLKNDKDPRVISLAKRQVTIENDPQIKKVLEKIIKNEGKQPTPGAV
ncbi:HEAT repeat domain-containing protein [Candidatus Micrarchaeota archaeon]|nr:HEAT repeat domain-containing protein [Candidatus Micrarchaeota archaeon]